MEAQNFSKSRLTIGWREWVGLPDLKVDAIKAKIDTGARTSALHAFRIEPFWRDGVVWVRFELNPIQRSQAMKVACEARAIDERTVRNSGGGVEQRYIIATMLRLGEAAWPIELALTNRDQMGFRMLLGRTALKDRILIEPNRSFLLGKAPAKLGRKKRAASRRPKKTLG
jgi:hypothetical protein